MCGRVLVRVSTTGTWRQSFAYLTPCRLHYNTESTIDQCTQDMREVLRVKEHERYLCMEMPNNAFFIRSTNANALSMWRSALEAELTVRKSTRSLMTQTTKRSA